MDQTVYDALKLENQLCFPLYAAAREIVKQYRPRFIVLMTANPLSLQICLVTEKLFCLCDHHTGQREQRDQVRQCHQTV